MNATLIKEITNIIEKMGYSCTPYTFINHANWRAITRECELSDEFIDVFSDHLSWLYISKFQNLSSYIIEKYKSRISLCKL